MRTIRLLPVVVLAITALLLFKTIGLVTGGGYVLAGVTAVRAAGGGGGGESKPAGEASGEAELALPHEPTLEDTSVTLSDTAPTLGEDAGAAGGGHGGAAQEAAPSAEAAAGHGEEAAADHPAAAPATSQSYCVDVQATLTDAGLIDQSGAPVEAGGGAGHGAAEPETAAEHGAGDAEEGAEGQEHAETAPAEPASFAQSMSTDCLPSGDAVPMQLGADGIPQPLISNDGTSLTEQQLLERLAARRTELERYEQDLSLRQSLVDAAEKRIEERQATLEALEGQISSLVDQRKEMESGQFASIVAMYETMKPKDAANIFNNLDIEVLLRVAKAMNPRKMAPILAAMDSGRAQELTVRMANLADTPVDTMSPDDLAALPQIVGQ